MSTPQFVVPQWVSDEMESRRLIAIQQYEALCRVTVLAPMIDRDEYVRNYMESWEPLTWTTGGSTLA